VDFVDGLTFEPLAGGDSPETLATSGYVVHSLQTALHDGLVADSAEDAIVTAVNHGGDTDTSGDGSERRSFRIDGWVLSTTLTNSKRWPSDSWKWRDVRVGV
jgi:hypothetical protein